MFPVLLRVYGGVWVQAALLCGWDPQGQGPSSHDEKAPASESLRSGRRLWKRESSRTASSPRFALVRSVMEIKLSIYLKGWEVTGGKMSRDPGSLTVLLAVCWSACRLNEAVPRAGPAGARDTQNTRLCLWRASGFLLPFPRAVWKLQARFEATSPGEAQPFSYLSHLFSPLRDLGSGPCWLGRSWLQLPHL